MPVNSRLISLEDENEIASGSRCNVVIGIIRLVKVPRDIGQADLFLPRQRVSQQARYFLSSSLGLGDKPSRQCDREEGRARESRK